MTGAAYTALRSTGCGGGPPESEPGQPDIGACASDWTGAGPALRRGRLVMLAGVAALRSNPEDDRSEGVWWPRKICPGTALTPR